MNENDKLGWLRGPLPPLSEAIKQSGMLVGNDIPDIPQTVPFSLPTELPKEVHSKTLKRKTKLPSPKEVKPRPKSKIQQPLKSLLPENFSSYRPPPVESLIGGVAKNVQHFKAPDFGEEKNSVKEEIARLNDSLDETIQSLLPDHEMDDKEKFDYTMKMVRVHNYAVNQLVLIDKNNCSDRALFIKRLATFYQEVIDDFPNYFTTYKEKIDNLQNEVQKYTDKTTKLEEELKTNQEKLAELKDKLEKLEEEKEKLIKESNDKDVDIQALNDKVQLYESSNITYQFKLKKEKEEKEQFQQMYKNIVEDQKQQLEVVENLSKQLKQREDGESGVVWDLRKAEVRINELQDQNTQLHKTIYALEHKERFDACVDTSDLPQETKGKKKKKQQQQQQQQNLPSDIPYAAQPIPQFPSQSRFNFSQTASGKISQNPSQALINARNSSLNLIPSQGSECGMKRIIVTKDQSTETEPTERESIEIQTDIHIDFYIPATEKGGAISRMNSIKLDPQSQGHTSRDTENTENQEHATVAVEFTEEELNSVLNIDEIEFNPVKGYEVDEEKLANIPNLFPTLVPIFGSPYRVVTPRGLDRLNIGKMTGIKKQDRSLVWGLQLIHNFLCDPFIRCYEAAQLDGAEEIFFEWLVRQYKVAHIVNQICGDISILIYTNREVEQFIRFFSDLMENNYKYAQLCFISTVYSFSINLSHPEITTLLQEIDLLPSHDKVTIHTKCAYALLSKLMSPILATAYFRTRINPHEPMINFVDFLRNTANFFNEKHRQLFHRSYDILSICCTNNAIDLNEIPTNKRGKDDIVVTYDVFNRFMCLLDSVEEHKQWWESILLEKKETVLDVTSLISVCAERRRPLLELLRLEKISTKIAEFNKNKPLVHEFFQHFLKRFTETVPEVIHRLPEEVVSKVHNYVEDLRQDFLNIDLRQILWHYRMFLSTIDQSMLDIVKQIPFSIRSPDEVFNDIIDFYNMAEKVSFSLMS